MAFPSVSRTAARRLRTPALVVALLGLVVWLCFFDSHSVLQRARWHREHARLLEENAQLQQAVEALEETLSEPLSDEVVEEIAREQYGMRRPGETVYRVETAEPGGMTSEEDE